MHRCISGSTFLVNVEVGSMGGVVDGGIGIGLKTSPRRAAIEKAQAELRQEYDVREERRKELEFLEQGGNPLDFKFGNTSSVSVHSTSLTDQHPEHFVTSEAKGSFALTASPHGDSVESSGRPGAPTICEPITADNLLLFDGETELPAGKRNSRHPPSTRNNIAQSQQSSPLDGGQSNKEAEDSAIFRPYARRNRSKSNRDGTRSSSDVVQNRSGQGYAIPASGGSRDSKGSIFETRNQQNQKIPTVSNLKSINSNGQVGSKALTSNDQLDLDLDSVLSGELTTRSINGDRLESKSDNPVCKSSRTDQYNQPCQVVTQKSSVSVPFSGSQIVGESEQLIPEDIESSPCLATTKAIEIDFAQVNTFSDSKLDSRISNGDINGNVTFGTKDLFSEFSCTKASLVLDVKNESKRSISERTAGNAMEQCSGLDETLNPAGTEVIKEVTETMAFESCQNSSEDQNSIYKNHPNSGASFRHKTDSHVNRSDFHNEVKHHPNVEVVQQSDHNDLRNDEQEGTVSGNDVKKHEENIGSDGSLGHSDYAHDELPETNLLEKDSGGASGPQACHGNDSKLVDKAREDSILEEGRMIEAKWKRLAELSIHTLPVENRQRSHWDYVLEEMEWMANDFAQERLWKIAAGAQIGRQAAFASQLRFEQQNQVWMRKEVAHTLAKAVIQFWHSAEVQLGGDDLDVHLKHCKDDLERSRRVDKDEGSEIKIGESTVEICNEFKLQDPSSSPLPDVKGYAVRFLKYNNGSLGPQHAEAPKTPDRISDLGILQILQEGHLTEESLFYTIPPSAMDTYRKSIESHLVRCEKTGNSVKEEVETSMCDTAGEFRHQENAYDEDEGESSAYYLSGAMEGSKSSKFSQQKWKNLMRPYTWRSYEGATDLTYGHGSTGAHQSGLMGKRPGSINVGLIPTKRMRTASRQRVLGPFGTGAAGGVQAQAKTDASSGDTNSFQDDQNNLFGGSQMQRSMEVESVGDFEKHVPHESAETSIKSNKKKKAKPLGSMYDHGWQLESTLGNEQKNNSKKRLEHHKFGSNGTSGFYGQHNSKKQKIMKHTLDYSLESMDPMAGSVPSPVASQMSNMSNTNRFIKLIGGRDRVRKAKASKMSARQSDSGSPWSLFEDQALVVLVHDMGPNWELVTDAINSSLQFKCIFRKPTECKERHKILMDKSAGDGADSAEDSGSSQPYPSTLPGIPKGSARQLFRRLQEPMEEDTLKTHFEKIIKIGQKLHSRRSQKGSLEPKHMAPVHNSHVMALSQVCPNNLNGSVLTPLDLCDVTAPNSDVVHLGYQGTHASGLSMPNQGVIAPVLPNSGGNSTLQGSSALVIGNNLSSPSVSLTASRDAKYGIARTNSLPVDEQQQKMQQYNQTLPGRNVQQSGLSVPGNILGNERNVRMLSGGNGMGMIGGMKRGMPISRPGLEGMASPPMLNSSNMVSSSMVGMANHVNMRTAAGPGQGNQMFRPREPLHIMRPGQTLEHQQEVTVSELQKQQVSQGSSQGSIHGLSSAFPIQTNPPPSIPSHPGAHHHQSQYKMPPQQQQQSNAIRSPHHPHHLQGSNHPTTPSQQQAYAIRLAKERQIQQQRYLQQQQQQQPKHFATSSNNNALLSHVQPPAQLPASSSSPLQNSPHLQPQTSSQQMLSLAQQKHHMAASHGLSLNPSNSGLNYQAGKQQQLQRQRQQQQQQQFQQQSGRHHPHQRQLTQSQPQPKLVKGVGRGNMPMHQSLSIDPSHLNGLSVPQTVNQAVENEEQQPIMQAMQGQSIHSGSGPNTVQQSKPLVPPSPSTSQVRQKHPHSDINSSVGQAPPVPSSSTSRASHQAPPAIMASSAHQPLPLQSNPPEKQVNQMQPSLQGDKKEVTNKV